MGKGVAVRNADLLEAHHLGYTEERKEICDAKLLKGLSRPHFCGELCQQRAGTENVANGRIIEHDSDEFLHFIPFSENRELRWEPRTQLLCHHPGNEPNA